MSSKMEEGANYLLAHMTSHSFCAANTPVEDKVRTIHSII